MILLLFAGELFEIFALGVSKLSVASGVEGADGTSSIDWELPP